MFREMTVQRISAGTLLKLTGVGLVFTFVPFTILMGCFALFGYETVTWNEQALVGVSGLLASPFIGLFIAGVFTVIIGPCIAIGLWVYSKYRPITIRIKVLDE